ncbi:MAG: polyphosphate kinase 1 [Solobacterium sp.]|nr:polyphosphate kinase 1 [Solobacterium sp.]
MIKNLYKQGYTQNRELSWLRFDERCLNEARDSGVPLLERLKFVSIFSSNLDEFFGVRVGSITDMKHYKPDSIDNKSGLTPEGQLKKIYQAANKLCDRREDVFRDLKRALRKEGIYDLSLEECTKEERAWLKKFFRTAVAPTLGAQIVDSRHPLPALQSGVIYAAGLMKYNGSDAFALVPVPSSLHKIVRLPGTKDVVRYVHMEDIILDNMESVFKGTPVHDKLKFMMIRNADVSVDDDSFEDTDDYRDRMMEMLKKRKRMSPVRVEVSKGIGEGIRRYLAKYIKAEERMVYISSMPLDRSYMFQIKDLLSPETVARLSYVPYTPKLSPSFEYGENLFAQIQKKDVLLSYPYESMDPFLLLVKEAAADPNVISIRITIYRLARKARLVDYLCLAAENGKEVDVLIELKARFDEQNNIDYSEKLMDAGCTVMYGFEDYKVHSKLCLISRMNDRQLSHVALISTGNFNENTARQYTDFAYLTARPGIVKDAVAFFQNMMVGKLDGSYRYLLVSPVSMKQTLLQLMDREIAKKEKGSITCKLNSITDEELIYKLHQASDAGVQIRLIVRGICCVLPEVKGKTDNLHVRSIVGRYLEHSRIYQFGSGRDEKLYISSADFMTRNTERRVEVAVPIQDREIKTKIHNYLDLCFADNTKARIMDSEGKYHHLHKDEPDFSSQDALMERTVGSNEALPQGTIRPAHKGIIFDTKFKVEVEVDPKPKKKKDKKPKAKSKTKEKTGKSKKK